MELSRRWRCAKGEDCAGYRFGGHQHIEMALHCMKMGGMGQGAGWCEKSTGREGENLERSIEGE